MPTTDPENSPRKDPGLRLQKFLADAGICSRREAERRIAQGRVGVNGQVIREMGFRVQPEDKIFMDGKPVQLKESLVYVLLHKPEGVVTSCHHRGERVVTDLVPLPQRIFPVGRLDKESTGLVLLINDGPLHHRLSHPSFDHEKEYVVTTRPSLSDAALTQMAAGMILEGRKTRPAQVFRMDFKTFRIILQEGRNRQIRKMVASLGARVLSLHRIRMAFLELRDLNPGQWRHLSPKEIMQLKKL